jgi:hypothetical protein
VNVDGHAAAQPAINTEILSQGRQVASDVGIISYLCLYLNIFVIKVLILYKSESQTSQQAVLLKNC